MLSIFNNLKISTFSPYEDLPTVDDYLIGPGDEISIKLVGAENDLLNCVKFAHKNTILAFDDTNNHLLNQLLNKYIDKKLIVEIKYDNIYQICNYHRLFNYVI